MEIRVLDTTDLPRVREHFDVEQRAIRADRPHALIREWPAFELVATQPSEYYRHVFLCARDGDVPLGVAHVDLPLRDNLHVAGIEIDVLPEHRRRGVGRALGEASLDVAREAGRTTILGEAVVDVDSAPSALEFAAALGFAQVHLEHHLASALPLPVRAVADDYEVITWTGRCPDEHRAAYIEMRSTMSREVPTGDLDLEAVVFDEERLANGESRIAQAYDAHVAAARRRSDGVFAGYSVALVAFGADYAWQDDTLVMAEHRGHGLGGALKSVNYARLPASVRAVHTWTDPTNTAMYRTNTAMGFVPVEHLHEVQRRL